MGALATRPPHPSATTMLIAAAAVCSVRFMLKFLTRPRRQRVKVDVTEGRPSLAAFGVRRSKLRAAKAAASLASCRTPYIDHSQSSYYSQASESSESNTIDH